MPMVEESISLSLVFSMTKWTPLVVGNLARPVLTGMTFTTLPFTVTFIVWLWTLTVLTLASPTRKRTVRSATPQVPGPALAPARRRVRVTFSPDGQNLSGRKWTSELLNQRQ